MISNASFRPADNAPSQTLARWLRWSQETGGDKSDVVDTAARLAAAFCHLVEGRGALLLSRRANDDELWPVAAHFHATGHTLFNRDFNDEISEENGAQESNSPHCARGDRWPHRALSPTEAAPDLQPFLHALGALMDEIGATNSETSHNEAWQHIALDGATGGGQTSLQVLAEAIAGADSAILDSDNVSWDVQRSPSQIDVAINDGRPQSDTNFTRRGAPSLLLPLHDFPTGSGEDALCGLVAVWLDDESGALAGSGRDLVQAALLQAEDWLAGAQRLERLGRSYRDLANAMARAIDERDNQAPNGRTNRSSSVAYLCGLIGQALQLDDVSIERLEFAGLLHSAGRIALPDKILYKRGALKDNERDAVREALHAGAQWFEEVDGLREVALMIRHQNERFDGSGYPDGLKGEEIPLGSRVLAIALRFAAMTQPRAQRAALPLVGGAFQNLRAEAGSALDPQLVTAFFRAMGDKES